MHLACMRPVQRCDVQFCRCLSSPSCFSERFAEQMPQCGQGMQKQHARAGISHDFHNPLAHVLAVAVYRTHAASGLVGAVRAVGEAGIDVFQQFRTFRT